ncbi:beta and beta-prime subunits of DNA dependent RNA-polymerase [Rhizopus microsporus var. microsporus]|uniref:DNA-directed RNA polymerase subunit n=2 Tax=Rhizopus microsporus TaxID=58291 RepID=A0A2G4SJQ0_RHIZD|nr:DNA-directed RNA polymerase I subunit RPA1 [Rhizopus microsporus ATCC 52813]ORE11227.1 beta and beta-prime subunits of DNA dependent RNA-polymerase [Rhizopus microsporus var. microsporus]PHZ08991.1 DNA-directed RNA polymerase I subunit RPA1 [Rhizopus microsporus ATCC 52813]
MNISVPIGTEVDYVSFSFYEPSEIRKISVKQIFNPILFDALGHPTKGGLYDPALGPFQKTQICATCSQDHFNCPGHFGHIEIPIPAYNPMFFDNLYAILRAKCVYCHQFRISRALMKKYSAQLTLLQHGLVNEAQSLNELVLDFKKTEAKDDETLEDRMEEQALSLSTVEDYIEHIDTFMKNALADEESRKFAAKDYKVTVINEVRKSVMRDFMKQCIHSKKCANCCGISPPIRRDGAAKLFQLALNKKDQAAMDRLKNQTGSFEEIKGFTNGQRFLTPYEVRKHVQALFEKEGDITTLLFGARDPRVPSFIKKATYHMFFIEVLAVAPTRFRPPSVMGDKTFESPQNELLSSILKGSHLVRDLSEELQAISDQEPVDKKMLETTRNRFVDSIIGLQHAVNSFIDSTKNPTQVAQGKNLPPGIRQALEKKEGLFRKHMMGKRVNYAARSVISPDPFIETSEIGIPPVFATKLTYPEPVTPHNIKEMRQAVINGPNKWPGATHVQNEDQSIDVLGDLSIESRIALANSLLAPQSSHTAQSGNNPYPTRTQTINKKVFRHLRNGDMLLLNRQPTLHKPSIMAHKARILPGEKTIRMHYANCNTYNADFDGDEMNIHFPQNEIARAEASFIANTDNQYLVPTSGNPLRGLIQDNVDSGVWMSSRDTFFTKEEYQQLLYGSLRPETDGTGGGKIRMLPPAIMKPQPLWTGKQVISTILKNLTWGKAQLNMTSKSKVPAKFWGPNAKEEDKVLVMDGELIHGVMDKSQFGASAFGLVHSVYEIYSPEAAGMLLSILSRLFIKFLQSHGFTCRMDDLVLTKEGDQWRRDLLDQGVGLGDEAHLEFLGLADTAKTASPEVLSKEFKLRMNEVIRDDNKLAGLDNAMKAKVNKLTSSITQKCLPDGLIRPFPKNDMQMMTVSGAKGSNVNATQISCLLGQQELEGRRVPLMVSGRSLPSFRPFDTSARAGGFVTGRFLTGIRPQEYYFHCMAGREGLIDTAVKTSRSGYLQRCLIKHLEGLRVHYDHTVRDSDGSVLQFHYGEDSLDVIKAKHINQFGFSAHNFEALSQKYHPKAALASLEIKQGEEYAKKALKKPGKYDPALSVYNPGTHLGVVSERFALAMKNYIQKNPDGMPFEKDSQLSKNTARYAGLTKNKFKALMNLKYLHSLVEPGEAVGLLAAQSVGEPSTQMTLNTFHFAGYGAANVTLGIPRLREIIMTAARKIKTPTMLLPLLPETSVKKATQFCKSASRLTLAQLVDNVVVREKTSAKTADNNYKRSKTYSIRVNLFEEKEYNEEYRVSAKRVKEVLATAFLKDLEELIRKDIKDTKKIEDISKAHKMDAPGDDDANEDLGDAAAKDGYASDDAEDMDAKTARKSAQNKPQASYDEPDEDDIVPEDNEKSLEDEEEEFEQAILAGADDEEEAPKRSSSKGGKLEEQAVQKSKYCTRFKFDDNNGAFCEIDMEFPADTKKILMISLIEKSCARVVVHEVKGISKCFEYINPTENDTSKRLQTEGVNLRGMWAFSDIIDVNYIDTNDIAAILNTYGVEAARNAIIKEVASVFAVYGIVVDRRHLTLIADYMTFEGGYKPFSRIGIGSNVAPFLKMSFESTCKFLTEATLHGDFDTLDSPSSRIVVGRVVEGGTGSFDVLQPLTSTA